MQILQWILSAILIQNVILSRFFGTCPFSDNPNMLMIAGGPMTGSTVAFENLVVNRSLGSVLVMPKVEVKEQPCLGCGKCAAHCPVHLTPTQIKRVLELKDVKLLETLKPNYLSVMI